MGFGLLLLGYFLMFLMSNLHPVFAFAGTYLVFLALNKLKYYKRSFKNAFYPTAAIMLLSFFDTVQAICLLLDFEIAFLSNKIVSYAVQYAYIAAVIAFHLVILLAIAELAKKTELEKIRVMSLRNLVFFVAYVLLYVLALLPFPALALQYIRLTVMLMQLFWTFLNIFLILKCFRNMCDYEKLQKENEKEIKEKKTDAEN